MFNVYFVPLKSIQVDLTLLADTFSRRPPTDQNINGVKLRFSGDLGLTKQFLCKLNMDRPLLGYSYMNLHLDQS